MNRLLRLRSWLGVVPSRSAICPTRLGCSFGQCMSSKKQFGILRMYSTDKHTRGMRFKLNSTEAFAAFETWCTQNTPFFTLPSNIRVTSALLPFWCFQADVLTQIGSKKWKHYMNGPTMMVYAGHTFRRTYAAVCKSPFDDSVAFSQSMLRLPDGNEVDFIDPFEVYETTAISLVQSQTLRHHIDIRKVEYPNSNIHMQLEGVTSHRVLMPAWVFEYTYAGQEFRVFVNGRSGEGFGAQQASLSSTIFRVVRTSISSGGIDTVSRVFSKVGVRSVPIILSLLRPVFEIVLRAAMSFPFLAVAGLGGIAVEGYFRFALRQKEVSSRAEWQEIIREERAAQAVMTDEWRFRPEGTTEADRQHARQHEDRDAGYGGSSSSSSSSSSSYSSSGSSSAGRRQHQQQHASGSRYASYERRDESTFREQKRSDSSSEAASLTRPKPVNERNPYDVLGIAHVGRRATKEDISAAFRLQLMKHHPDHNSGKDADQAAFTDRTRLIIESYRRLKDPSKRRDVDAMFGST